MLNGKPEWFTVYKVVNKNGEEYSPEFRNYCYKTGLNITCPPKTITTKKLEEYIPAFHCFLTKKGADAWGYPQPYLKLVKCIVPKSAIIAYGLQNKYGPVAVCSHLIMPKFGESVVRTATLKKAKREYAKLTA